MSVFSQSQCLHNEPSTNSLYEDFIKLELGNRWYELTGPEREILRRLQSFYKNEKQGFKKRISPRMGYWSKALNRAERTVSRSLNNLKRLGFIEILRKGQRGSEYELPECLRKIKLESTYHLTVEEPPPDPGICKKNSVNGGLNGGLNTPSAARENGPPNSLTPELIGNLKTDHISSDADAGFFESIKLEKKSSIEVATIWRGFKFQDGTSVTDNDMRCWLGTKGALATHGAMLAYQFEMQRRKDKGTKTKEPGVRFVQSLITSGKWRRQLVAARNRDTAMQHLRGSQKALYRVNYSSAYIDKQYDIQLDTTHPEQFTEIIFWKTGIKPEMRPNAFDKYIPNCS